MIVVVGQTVMATLPAPGGVTGMGARIEVPITRAIVSAWRPAVLEGSTWIVTLEAPVAAGEYLLVWRTGDPEPPGYEAFVPLIIEESSGSGEPGREGGDHGLTVARLRSYLDLEDSGSPPGSEHEEHETVLDTDMLEATLAAAVRFCERYCNIVLTRPVDADLADAIYTAAARQWRERDAAWSDIAQRNADGADITYFRGLPQRVKMTYDLVRNRGALSLT